jgi:hypothetical protein
MPIRNRIAEWHDEIACWRRDLHAHPELLFDTHRTAGIVADKLSAFGCDAVVDRHRADRRGRDHQGARPIGSGRVIGLRADMDALPIEERRGQAHGPRPPGKMHACGHDGHTAMLLGAAQYLAETRNFDGTVVVIFQPAEEGGGRRRRDGRGRAQHAGPAGDGPFFCRGRRHRQGRDAAKPSIGAGAQHAADRIALPARSGFGHLVSHGFGRAQRHPRNGAAARHRAQP